MSDQNLFCQHDWTPVLADTPMWMLPNEVKVKPWEGQRSGRAAELAGPNHPEREALYCRLCGGFVCEWHRMGMDAREEIRP